MAKTTSGKNSKAGMEKGRSEIMDIYDEVYNQMEIFIITEKIDTSLTGKERMRLIGAGVRNYGFIDKAWDIAYDNAPFNPPNFSITQMGTDLRELEALRQLALTLEKFQAIVNEALLIKSDKLYRGALRIYGSLREQARNKVPGAETLYRALLTYFRRRRGTGEAEPTTKELERDFHKLLHGTADGEIEIVSETPHMTGGVHKVVDDVRRGSAKIKETAEAEIKTGKTLKP